MKSIYETKSYKLILSYYTNTKLHKNNVFSKMITFNVVEFDSTKCDYFITINIYILKDEENEISFNTYNGYDSMYAPLFYNEYKQLLYHDYFIGE